MQKTSFLNHQKVSSIFLFLLFFSSFCYAQKPSLTKEETIDYINKKLEQIKDTYVFPNNSNEELAKRKFVWNGIRVDSEGIIEIDERISSTGSGINYGIWTKDPLNSHYLNNSYSFSLLSVKEVEYDEADNNDENKTGTLVIWLNSKSAKKKFRDEYVIKANEYGLKDLERSEEETLTTHIPITFSTIDPTNATKLKKAFEYLIELVKAEDDDDPFK